MLTPSKDLSLCIRRGHIYILTSYSIPSYLTAIWQEPKSDDSGVTIGYISVPLLLPRSGLKRKILSLCTLISISRSLVLALSLLRATYPSLLPKSPSPPVIAFFHRHTAPYLRTPTMLSSTTLLSISSAVPPFSSVPHPIHPMIRSSRQLLSLSAGFCLPFVTIYIIY